MLFELTTGKRLFKGASEYETLRLICDRDYPVPSQVRLGYPRELEAVVMRALAKDRAHRWQSAREMQGALEEFVRRERLGVSTIALSQFMQGLFEEKLASQKEALLQGKQLADIIALENPTDSTTNLTGDSVNGSTTSNPAMHTLADATPSRPKQGATAMVAIGLGAALAIAGGAVFWAKHRQAATIAAASGESQVARGALAIATEPPGASIAVNGEKRAETTPATITKLAIGTPYQITLSRDGFEDTTKSVTLTDQEPSVAMSITLRRGVMTLDVGLNQGVTSPTLVLDTKPYSTTTIENVTAGEAHQLVVQAPGFAPQSLSFTGAANEHKHLDVTLARADARPADRIAHAPVGGGGSPAPATAAAAVPASAATGKLNVSAKGGWCNVTIDGTPRGPTPIAGIILPAGAHSVTCAPEGGKAMSQSVRVEADSTARFAFTIPQ